MSRKRWRYVVEISTILLAWAQLLVLLPDIADNIVRFYAWVV